MILSYSHNRKVRCSFFMVVMFPHTWKHLLVQQPKLIEALTFATQVLWSVCGVFHPRHPENLGEACVETAWKWLPSLPLTWHCLGLCSMVNQAAREAKNTAVATCLERKKEGVFWQTVALPVSVVTIIALQKLFPELSHILLPSASQFLPTASLNSVFILYKVKTQKKVVKRQKIPVIIKY